MKTLHLHIEEPATSTEQLAGYLEDIAILIRQGKKHSFKPVRWWLVEGDTEETEQH